MPARKKPTKAEKERKWFDDISKDHAIDPNAIVGVEIVARLVIDVPDDLRYIDEALEKFREYGAAEVTKKVLL